MILKLKRTPGLYLVGFMGSGKSTVGQLVAYELGWSFVDIDEEIEVRERMSVAQIFDHRGERIFRQIESEMIHDKVRLVQRGRPMVMALGGGAFAQQVIYEFLEENGVTVWLDCPLDVVRDRIGAGENRPLARDPVAMADLFERRRDAYLRADFRIDATSDPHTVCSAILELPIF
jgi:shikimate kinase